MAGAWINERLGYASPFKHPPQTKQRKKTKLKSARKRAIAAEPLGDPPLFSVRHKLSFNAFLYAVVICISAAFSLSIYNEVAEKYLFSIGFDTER